MAHEPKLQVFKIYLNPKSKNENNSFRELFKQKFHLNDDDFEKTNIFNELLKDIVSTIDEGYFLHEGKKKALGIEKDSENTSNLSIKAKSENSLIHGLLQGGRYGQDRSVGNLNDSTKRESLKKENVVLDKYYFLIYSPTGSNKGIAMVHSYTDDTVNDIFINWIREIFTSDGFYKPDVQPYSPNQIKDEFINKSYIKEFKYSKDILISEIDAIDSIKTKEWTIEVVIRAKENGVEISSLDKLVSMFKGVSLKSKKKEFKLNEFNKKTGQLNDGVHQNSFKLSDKIDIQPTIYLKEKIGLETDGSPKWNELEKFCSDLLKEIIPEVYPENEELS